VAVVTRVASAVLVAVGLVLAGLLGLNGDVQQTIGGINVAGEGPFGAVDVFTHRPLVYRLIVGGLHAPASLLGEPGSDAYELGFRILGMALAAGAAGLLAAGLRRYLPRAPALAAAAVIGTVLVLATPWGFMQPEWVAGVIAVAAVGAGLLPRRPVIGAVIGGLLAAAVVAAKLATAPIAVGLLIAVALVDRRRAGWMAVATACWVAAWIVWSLSVPGERMWMPDMVALAPGAPWRSGISLAEVDWALRSVGSKALAQPVVLMLPIATAILCTGRTRARAATVIVLVILAGVLALAPLAVQGVWYLYHAEALPIVAAAVLGLATGRVLSERNGSGLAALAVATLVVSGVAAYMLSLEPTARGAHVRSPLLLAAVVSVLLAGLLPVAGGIGRAMWRRRIPTIVAAGMAATLSLPALLPASAWSFDPRITGRSNATWRVQSVRQREHMTKLSQAIGRPTEVLYLAYGDVAYYMANPTDCPYPSPAFLKVATRAEYVESLATYRDNLDCLTDADEPYAVVQPGWLFDGPRTTTIRELLDRSFDCSRAIVEAGIQACPRRL
jgi:hypothetical protein